MGSIEETQTLEAALTRIVPDAMDPHVVGFLSARLNDDPATREIVRASLILLQARDFVHLSPEVQDATLGELEAHPLIALLIRLCVEGFYTSPAGLAAVGFRVTA